MDVMTYMEGKTFYNSGNGLEIEYGYVSAYGTYGIKVTNKNGGKFYYIDVKISTYGGYADLYGMDPDNGNNFGFRLYKGKLIVGRGEAGETTFYLRWFLTTINTYKTHLLNGGFFYLFIHIALFVLIH